MSSENAHDQLALAGITTEDVIRWALEGVMLSDDDSAAVLGAGQPMPRE